MQLQVISKDGKKYLKDVVVGELLLCDDGHYYPVRNKLLVIATGVFCRLSNGCSFHVYDRIKIKTSKGFKCPELWDVIPVSKDLEPVVATCQISLKKILFYDILIDGNTISPEGIVFMYGE